MLSFGGGYISLRGDTILLDTPQAKYHGMDSVLQYCPSRGRGAACRVSSIADYMPQQFICMCVEADLLSYNLLCVSPYV